MQTLNQVLDAALQINDPGFFKRAVPDYVYANLREGFGQRPYQQEAFGRFVYYWSAYPGRRKGVPAQLLYHMATGSGKTLVMAGLIVYLYQQGYRNFLFFVNSTTIIEKTKDNFLNPSSSKYLFADALSVGDQNIGIKEVENFQAVNADDINIAFSTIQGLHTKLNTPRENSLTYEDFEDKKLVLISDEAHHINAETKKKAELSTEEKEEIISWEGTVNRIFQANPDNILLEFTATADLSSPEIAQKYKDKLIFDYPLKQFRNDGYSKEVKVLQADLPPLDRAVQAMLLSQYRRKLFERYKKIIKPVILFKSRTIKESQAFHEEFVYKIKNLTSADLERIKRNASEGSLHSIFHYLEVNGISLENLVAELREDFAVEKLIVVNSKDESEAKQLAVNSLEDEGNEYRAVFAVDKLNEGWDVLNLFDIVRLYDTRDAKASQPGKTTMAEAQLIGRGARYCPFQLTDDQPAFMRKFDEDSANELRVCEELYYHSAYNPRYIQELNTALEEIGIKPAAGREREVRLKPEFKQTDFYKKAFLFLNEREKYDREDMAGLSASITGRIYRATLKTGYTKTTVAFNQVDSSAVDKIEKAFRLLDFGLPIIRKALSRLTFYEFAHLKKYLPRLTSVSEFITSPDYLGKIRLDLIGLPTQIEQLSGSDKLGVAISILEDISTAISFNSIEYRGTRTFKPVLLKDIIKDKVLNFAVNESEDREFGRSMIHPGETNYHLDLSKKEWYAFDDCFGTSEEKSLIKYIDKIYEELKSKYSEIYLVRNERHFRIFSFDDGRPVEPDFVLFLVDHEETKVVQYQVFIEPKGAYLFKTDEWKEKFLVSLKEEALVEQLWANKEFVIWGLPFYNSEMSGNFERALENIYKD